MVVPLEEGWNSVNGIQLLCAQHSRQTCMGSQCSPLLEMLLRQMPGLSLHVGADLSSQGASQAVLTELGGFGRPQAGLALSLALPRARLPALTRVR